MKNFFFDVAFGFILVFIFNSHLNTMTAHDGHMMDAKASMKRAYVPTEKQTQRFLGKKYNESGKTCSMEDSACEMEDATPMAEVQRTRKTNVALSPTHAKTIKLPTNNDILLVYVQGQKKPMQVPRSITIDELVKNIPHQHGKVEDKTLVWCMDFWMTTDTTMWTTFVQATQAQHFEHAYTNAKIKDTSPGKAQLTSCATDDANADIQNTHGVGENEDEKTAKKCHNDIALLQGSIHTMHNMQPYSGDYTHDDMVNAIKQYQKKSYGNTVLWRQYCAQPGKWLDPKLHDEASLKKFVLENCIEIKCKGLSNRLVPPPPAPSQMPIDTNEL